MARLKIKLPSEPEARQIELVDDVITIGRDPSNIVVLADSATSRRHAEIVRTLRGWAIQDLSSSNGTWVNGERAEDRHLADGDELLIGAVVMSFEDPPPAARTVRVDVNELVGPVSEMATQPAARLEIPPGPPKDEPGARPASLRTAAVDVRPSAEASPQLPDLVPIEPPPPPPVSPANRSSPPPAAPRPGPAAGASTPPEPSAGLAELLPPAPMPPAVPPVRPPAAAAPRKTGPVPTSSSRARTADTKVSHGTPAGFWIRAAAYLIDMVILSVAMAVILIPTAMIGGALGERSSMLAGLIILLGTILATALALGYLIRFWATRGATPGKRLLKLEVIRQDGVTPLGYPKAAIRALGYIVSSFLCIGFLMVAFTKNHLGLHDMMAGTRVVRKG